MAQTYRLCHPTIRSIHTGAGLERGTAASHGLRAVGERHSSRLGEIGTSQNVSAAIPFFPTRSLSWLQDLLSR